MPELVERGHIYIAQPPLFKVKQGKIERYVKDEDLLNQFMLELALNDAGFIQDGSNVLNGNALAAAAQVYLKAVQVIESHSRFIDKNVLEALMHMDRISLASEESTTAAIDGLKKILDGKSIRFELGYDDMRQEYRIKIVRTEHGNYIPSTLDGYFIESGDYSRIVRAYTVVNQISGANLMIYRGDNKREVANFGEGLNWLMQEVKKGMSIQRYKGLGEMNASQLWETTMDPNVRSLLKVTIEDALAADNIFSTLMGDEVEPRRDFIETNALHARNIDV